METQLYKVELLHLEDVDWFVNIAAKRMLEEELKRGELFNPEQLYKLTFLALQQQSAFVVRKDGVLVGATAGIVSPNLYNPSLMDFVELFWYVLPSSRSGRAGILLIDALIERGSHCNTTTVSLLPMSNIKHKTLEKRGFILREYGFVKHKEI